MVKYVYVENDEEADELADVVVAGASATAAAEALGSVLVGTPLDEATNALKPCDPGRRGVLDAGEMVVDVAEMEDESVGESMLDNNVGMATIEETDFFDNSGLSIEKLSEVVTGVGSTKSVENRPGNWLLSEENKALPPFDTVDDDDAVETIVTVLTANPRNN